MNVPVSVWEAHIRPEVFVALRHSNNDVLGDAVDNRQRVEQDRRAVRALKQGLGNPPSSSWSH